MNSKKKAIVVLGGGLVKKGSVWKTIDLGEGGDDFAASNDRWRVEAAAILWQNDPDYFIIASGGKGQLEKITDAPTLAQAIKRELMELQVPENRIIKEEESGGSVSQLKKIPGVAKKNLFEIIKILSNEWHIPRVKVMFNLFPGLKESFNGIKVDFLTAENILLEDNPEKWKTKIEDARTNSEMKKRYELEKQGMEQMKKGTYKFRSI